MNARAGFFAGVLAIAALYGCSAPDPGAVTLGPRHDGVGSTTGGTSAGGGGGGDAGAGADGGARQAVDGGPSGSGSGSDGGGASDGGGGGSDGAAAPNAFTGAGPYQSQPVATSAKQEHTNRGVGVDPTGLNCQGCHNGAATKFGIAGTVYTSANGGTGAADVQVRVVKSDGTEYVSVHTDADGNFWVPDQNAFAAVGGRAGARSANATQLMPQQVNAGTCNNCHDGNQQPRLHVP